MNAKEQLEEIKRDNFSGASEILIKARDCLIAYLEETQSSSVEGYIKQLSSFGKNLAGAQPSMAPLFNYVNHVLLYLQDSQDGSLDVQKLKNEAISVSEEYIRNSQNAKEGIKKNIFTILEDGQTILTHSYSSTVIGLLVDAQKNGKNLTVMVPESRPGYEGRKTARILSESGMNTILFADMTAFSLLKDVDLVLVGCDTICKQGVVNKIGTLGLSLAASNYERPFYIASESSKFLPSIYRNEPKIENKDPDEIMKNPQSIEIRNLYFDITPYDLITGIINEEGILRSHEIEMILDGLRVSDILLD
jgi:eIF-2B alpha/beta/delta-like uncharacterized protein